MSLDGLIYTLTMGACYTVAVVLILVVLFLVIAVVVSVLQLLFFEEPIIGIVLSSIFCVCAGAAYLEWKGK